MLGTSLTQSVCDLPAYFYWIGLGIFTSVIVLFLTLLIAILSSVFIKLKGKSIKKLWLTAGKIVGFSLLAAVLLLVASLIVLKTQPPRDDVLTPDSITLTPTSIPTSTSTPTPAWWQSSFLISKDEALRRVEALDGVKKFLERGVVEKNNLRYTPAVSVDGEPDQSNPYWLVHVWESVEDLISDSGWSATFCWLRVDARTGVICKDKDLPCEVDVPDCASSE